MPCAVVTAFLGGAEVDARLSYVLATSFLVASDTALRGYVGDRPVPSSEVLLSSLLSRGGSCVHAVLFQAVVGEEVADRAGVVRDQRVVKAVFRVRTQARRPVKAEEVA